MCSHWWCCFVDTGIKCFGCCLAFKGERAIRVKRKEHVNWQIIIGIFVAGKKQRTIESARIEKSPTTSSNPHISRTRLPTVFHNQTVPVRASGVGLSEWDKQTINMSVTILKPLPLLPRCSDDERIHECYESELHSIALLFRGSECTLSHVVSKFPCFWPQ